MRFLCLLQIARLGHLGSYTLHSEAVRVFANYVILRRDGSNEILQGLFHSEPRSRALLQEVQWQAV